MRFSAMAGASTSPHDWAVVLAGGSGRRLAHLTRDASGVSVPKQFCSLGRGESLVHMALRRAAEIAPAARTLVVVTQHHEKWWRDLRQILPAKNLIVQPSQRGTGIGILHPLLEILARDPTASIAVLPSDHYFSNEETLSAGLRMAMTCARKPPGQILLLGFEPDEADPELGYIVPSSPTEQNVCSVRRFVEKPNPHSARTLIGQGALWNSFIIVADGRALLSMFQRLCPIVVSRLRKFMKAACPDAQGREDVSRMFDQLPTIDFSQEILARSVNDLRVVPFPACGWSDLGTESRLHRTLSRHRSEISGAPAAKPGARGHVDLAKRDARAVPDGAGGSNSQELSQPLLATFANAPKAPHHHAAPTGSE